jgi:phytoene dehydrogenase-like protein
VKSSVNSKVVIVGAGLAGLCCGRRLAAAGVPFEILEESDAVGGRVRTDLVNGFRLDRGFQVLLTAYPEARAVLDYEALDLKPFYPGALVWRHGSLHRLADPFREPADACKNLFNSVGTLADKVRVARLRRRTLAGSVEDLYRRPDLTTQEALRHLGFSRSMIERFFRPFFGGIFLDRDLATSSRQMEFVFRMFACGDTAVPAAGMQAIPEQIAAKLPPGSVRTRTGVRSIEKGAVVLASGERRTARAVVVATDPWRAASLVGAGYEPPGSRSAACLYFATDEPPIDEPILMLDGEGKGPVNNLVEMSAVAPSYAPPRTALIAASVVDPAAVDAPDLEQQVRHQLERWFGIEVRTWEHLRTDRIRQALPDQRPPFLDDPHKPVRLRPGLYLAGDHRENGSIQGAMVAGRRAAEAVLEGAS